MNAKNRHPWRLRLATLGASSALAAVIAAPTVAHDNDEGGSTKTPIKHVVVIFPENRSFDHYFATYPNAANKPGEPKFQAQQNTPAVNNLLSAALLTKNPNLRQPFRYNRSEAYTCSLDHNYTDEQKAVNGGLYDMFVQATSRVGLGCRADGSSVMGYFDGNTVTALWNYAQHFAMSDNSFDTNFGPSTVGALNLVSGMTGNSRLALTFAAGKVATFQPVTVTGDPDPALDDCGQDAGGTKTGKATAEMQGKNVGDLLNAKGITWGWFQGGFAPTATAVLNPDGSTATAAVCGATHPGHPGVPNPSALDGNTTVPPTDVHGPVADYSAHHEPFQYYASTRNAHHVRPASVSEIGHNGPANHQYDISDFYAALKVHKLPAVSYLKPAAFQDEHPGNSDPLSFQTFLVDVVNTLQQSDEWQDTAVIISWDDSDGWYDHMSGPVVSHSAFNSGTDNGSVNANDSLVPVTPLSASTTPGNGNLIPTSGICGNSANGASLTAPRCGYGMRLPFLVISPWSKENFVDHVTTDQSSSLAFIEYNWSLGNVDPTPTPVNQGGSFDQIAGSILGMFDFDGHPNTRSVILDDQSGLVVGDHDHGGHH